MIPKQPATAKAEQQERETHQPAPGLFHTAALCPFSTAPWRSEGFFEKCSVPAPE
jgi:hypothetical protein